MKSALYFFIFVVSLFNHFKAQTASAINCDGLNDYVDPNNLITSFSNNFTIESWVRPVATHQMDAESTSGISGISNKRYMLWPTWRNFDGGIGISVGTNGVSVYEHGSNFINALLVWSGAITNWTHIAVTFTNKQPSLYVNGALVKTGLASLHTNVWPSLGACNQYPGQVGGLGGGSYGYYQGEMDEFRLWKTTRTQTEIQTWMNSEFFCSDPNLYAYYKFNHGVPSGNNSGITSASDFSGNAFNAQLYNFTLNGSTSNWISPGGVLSGSASLNTSASANSICAGQTVTLSVSGTTSNTWNPGAYTNSTIVQTPSVTTTYTVIGTFSAGCFTTSVLTITVNPYPTVSSNTATICSPNPATLVATGANSYTWNTSSTSSVIVVSPSITTNYTVTGANSSGCTNSFVTTVSVGITPTITVNSATICSGNQATLSASGASTYTFNPGGITGSAIAVSPTATITYTVTGSNGQCSGTNTSNIVVNVVPNVNLSVSANSICTSGTGGSMLSLTGSPSGGVYSGTNVSGNVFNAPATNGTFIASYSYTNTLGCSGSATLNVYGITCTGIKGYNENDLINIYPNPNKGYLYIESKEVNLNKISFTIIDILGNVLRAPKLEFFEGRSMIQMKDMESGIYFLVMNVNSKQEVRKIIID
jgi:hypothetical protein